MRHRIQHLESRVLLYFSKIFCAQCFFLYLLLNTARWPQAYRLSDPDGEASNLIRIMKKSILVLSLCLLSLSALADGIRIKKRNGGRNGFKTVLETHVNSNHTLDCENKGNTACSFEIPPGLIDFSGILSSIEAAIEAGTYSGVETFGDITVTWTGTGPYDVEIEFIY